MKSEDTSFSVACKNPAGRILVNLGQGGTRHTPVSADEPGHKLLTGHVLVLTEKAVPHVLVQTDQEDQRSQDIDAI